MIFDCRIRLSGNPFALVIYYYHTVTIDKHKFLVHLWKSRYKLGIQGFEDSRGQVIDGKIPIRAHAQRSGARNPTRNTMFPGVCCRIDYAYEHEHDSFKAGIPNTMFS